VSCPISKGGRGTLEIFLSSKLSVISPPRTLVTQHLIRLLHRNKRTRRTFSVSSLVRMSPQHRFFVRFSNRHGSRRGTRAQNLIQISITHSIYLYICKILEYTKSYKNSNTNSLSLSLSLSLLAKIAVSHTETKIPRFQNFKVTVGHDYSSHSL
jgi:hypothetical protein